MSVAAASDGYIVAGSNYDGKLYVLGTGPSQPQFQHHRQQSQQAHQYNLRNSP